MEDTMNKPISEVETARDKFYKKFGDTDDWDNELYQKTPVGWKNVNHEAWKFVDQAIQATREEFVEDLKKAWDTKLGEGSVYWYLTDLINKYSPQQKEERI
jgi:hypothetical protein